MSEPVVPQLPAQAGKVLPQFRQALARQRLHSLVGQPPEVVANTLLGNKGTANIAPLAFQELLLDDPYFRSLAAEATTLLPALPVSAAGTGLTKIQYRQMVREAKTLASGGEGLFANFIETMQELNAGGFENRLSVEGEGNQAFISIYNTMCRNVNADPKTGVSLAGKQRGMDKVQEEFTFNWWTTGMVVTTFRFGNVPIPALNSRQFPMIQELEVLDSLRIDLNGDTDNDWKALGILWYEGFSSKTVDLIRKQVRALGGDATKHPFFSLYPKKPVDKTDPTEPQNVFSAEEAYRQLTGKGRIPLPPDGSAIIRRTADPAELYPTPFAARIFAPVNDKRMLRAMDRSLMRRVIMMILHIRVGSPNPNRPVLPKDLSTTRASIEGQLRTDPEYVQMLTTVSDTVLTWIMPDQTAILDGKKYKTVDWEILSALIGLVAVQLLNATGQMDIAMLGKALYSKNQLCVRDFKRFLEERYDSVIDKAKIKAIKRGDVKPVFKQISLFEPESFKAFIRAGIEKGWLPAELGIEHIGEDFQTTRERLLREKADRDEFGIWMVPPTNNQTTDSAPDGKKSGPGGRPEGSPDSEPRPDEEEEPEA